MLGANFNWCWISTVRCYVARLSGARYLMLGANFNRCWISTVWCKVYNIHGQFTGLLLNLGSNLEVDHFPNFRCGIVLRYSRDVLGKTQRWRCLWRKVQVSRECWGWVCGMLLLAWPSLFLPACVCLCLCLCLVFVSCVFVFVFVCVFGMLGVSLWYAASLPGRAFSCRLVCVCVCVCVLCLCQKHRGEMC